jgi:hypothetical protein
LLAVAVAALVFGVTPATASAHLRSGTVAVDYRASVIAPNTSAYAAVIYQSDHGLSLTIKPGHTVTVLGYLGEPAFRLDRAGLSVNVASPTAVAVGLATKAQRIVAPTPRWRLQRGRRSAAWHDARDQGLPPGVDQGRWSVPLIVDGRRTLLEGELHRFPPPLLWPWLGILLCFLAAAAALAVRRRDRLRSGAIAFAVAGAVAAVVTALAFVLDAYASPGTWIAGLDEIAILAVGLGVLLWGRRQLHLGAAIGLGLLGLAVGISEGSIFLHPIVLSILPATAIRIVVVAAIGAGLDAAVLGCVYYVQTPGPSRDANPDHGFPTAVRPPYERVAAGKFDT